MGRLGLEGMREMAGDDTVLHWHLSSNHYPPVHASFIPVARRAIELARNGDFDTVIDMPNGKSLTVERIIEGLHLDSFLDE